MPSCVALSAIISTLLAFAVVSPVQAAGEIVITQAKALAGNVTPGDAPGYPVTLSQPGAYVLESNLTVTPGTYGIFAGANNIDIDMNGFTLSGNGSGTYGLISPYGESRIHDGAIIRFLYAGLYLRNSAWIVAEMQISRNGGVGIDASGARSITVKGSSILSNGGTGVRAGADGRIETSNVSRNGGDGVYCRAGCYVAGNSLNENLLNGVLIDQDGGTVIDNVINKNGQYGLLLADYDGVRTIPAYVGFANNSIVSNGVAPRFSGGGREIQPNFCFLQPC